MFSGEWLPVAIYAAAFLVVFELIRRSEAKRLALRQRARGPNRHRGR